MAEKSLAGVPRAQPKANLAGSNLLMRKRFEAIQPNVAARVRAVMAYADYCASKGVSCARIAFLSNPFKKSKNGVLGVNVGATNPAYNARRLTETKAMIAAYR